MRIAALVAGFMLLGMCGGAWAQSVVPGPFGMFTMSRYYNDLVTRGLVRLPSAVLTLCPKLVQGTAKLLVLEPVTMAANGFPISGFWKQTLPVSGCGNDTTLNLFFRADKNQVVETLVGVPGETHADLALQPEARQIALTAASQTIMGCGRYDVIDTRFDGEDAGAADAGVAAGKRPWLETWSMAGCDQVALVPLAFQPDATGTRVVQRGEAKAR